MGHRARRHAALIRELGATPIDYQREDFTRVLPDGFDVVFDGIAQDGYRRSFAALEAPAATVRLRLLGRRAGPAPNGDHVDVDRAPLSLELVAGGKRARFYSINLMRAQHPAWFREDLERLFGLLASGTIRPRVAERISFDRVAEAHRRIEAGGLDGKLVLCPDLPSRRDPVPP